MKLIFTIPVVIIGVLIALNFPELRRYLRLSNM